MAVPLTVFHTISSLDTRLGGPPRTVTQLADGLARTHAVEVSLIFQLRKGESSVQTVEPLVHRFQGESVHRSMLLAGRPFAVAVSRALAHSRPAIVHDHGIWTAVNHRACRFATRLGVPYVVHPRGMLEPWSLSYRARKKALAMWLYQRKNLERVVLFMATAAAEAENLRTLGLRQPVAVIPNGILLSSYMPRPPEGDRQDGKKTALFLSRIHPKKGLENLIDAWSQLEVPDWKLLIAGPDEGNHLADIMRRIEERDVGSRVHYVGTVEGDAKARIYQAADLFILPTYSENFGVVIAEALSFGVPAITTRGAPWEDLETYGCGWWINIGVEPLVDALRQAMSLSDDARRAMGMRGREYVKRYNWDSIAQQTIEVYQWVLGQGSKPDCVHLD